MLTSPPLKLTEGPINHRLLALATPIIIGSLFQQLYNTVDSLVIGQWLGQTAFAASGLAAVLINVCIFLLTGCCAGVAIILANLFGANDLPRFRCEVFLAGWMGTIFALLISALGWISLPRVLAQMQTPPEAMVLALSYLNIIVGGLILTFWYNFFASILRAVGDTKCALYFLIAANLLNTLLDLVLIGACHCDIRGAAWATVLSQGAAALLCALTLRKCYPELWPRKEDCHFEGALCLQTLHYASVSALQSSLLCIGNVFVQRSVNILGIPIMAAFTAASRVENIVKSFAAAGAVALGIFVAQNEGARRRERSLQGWRWGLIYLGTFGALAGLAMHVWTAPLIGFFVSQAGQDMVTAGSVYLSIITWFYAMPFIANAFQGWFRGTGRLNIPFIGTALQLAIRAYLSMTFTAQYGLEAVAWATLAGWSALLLMQVIIFVKERNFSAPISA